MKLVDQNIYCWLKGQFTKKKKSNIIFWKSFMLLQTCLTLSIKWKLVGSKTTFTFIIC